MQGKQQDQDVWPWQEENGHSPTDTSVRSGVTAACVTAVAVSQESQNGFILVLVSGRLPGCVFHIDWILAHNLCP
jgi:hypothetical protein